MTSPVAETSPPERPPPAPTTEEKFAWGLMAATLLLVLAKHLVPALVGGLAVYALVRWFSARLAGERMSHGRSRVVAVALLGLVTVGVAGLFTVLLVAFLKGKAGDLPSLLDHMAAVLDQLRDRLGHSLPIPDVTELRGSIAHGLREHARELREVGAEVGRTLMHTLLGIVIGALVSFDMRRPEGPFLQAIGGRIRRLELVFARIVSAQVKISGLNALLTGLFLLVGLPLFGIQLPLRKTLVVFTFLVGLIPIAGNLISNTVIVIIALGTSLGAAVACLAFLVVVHKLEYFVNARIVGGEIDAAAWEMLLAIFVFETLFGIQGVIAAPIFYAYLKSELAERGLIR
jgi:predicted PurR-regulated permease PerM